MYDFGVILAVFGGGCLLAVFPSGLGYMLWLRKFRRSPAAMPGDIRAAARRCASEPRGPGRPGG
ncbi:MAG: hypothetical protein P4M02_11370 [Clostridia bacterium]|nr:hypothetical protein [Clostridia bacterium]